MCSYKCLCALLRRVEEFWPDATLKCLLGDESSCQLRRFASPEVVHSTLMGSVKEAIRIYIAEVLRGLLEELCTCIDTFVTLTSPRSSISVRYDIDDRKACKAHVRLHLTDMVHTLIAIATAESRLVAEYGLTQAITKGKSVVCLMDYMSHIYT